MDIFAEVLEKPFLKGTWNYEGLDKESFLVL